MGHKLLFVGLLFWSFLLSAEDKEVYVIIKAQYHYDSSDYYNYKGVSYPFKVNLEKYPFLKNNIWASTSSEFRSQILRRARISYLNKIEIIINKDRTQIKEQYNELIKEGFRKFTLVTLLLRKTQDAYLSHPASKTTPEVAEKVQADDQNKAAVVPERKPPVPKKRAYWDVYD